MELKVSVFVINSIFMAIVLMSYQASAAPFFNPFNLAIQTDFGKDGNKVSFLYPKNTQTFTINFDSKQINENKFDFQGLISSIVRRFTQKFKFINPFRFSGPTTTTSTTPDPNFEFSDEEGFVSSSGSISSSSSNTKDDDTTNDSKEDEPESKVEEHENSAKEDESDDGSADNFVPESEDGDVSSNGQNGYGYKRPKGDISVETVNVDYLPPHSVSTLPSYYVPPY